MALNLGKSSASWTDLVDEDEFRADELMRTTEKGSSQIFSDSENGVEEQNQESFDVVTEVDDERFPLPPPVAEEERLRGIQNMSPPPQPHPLDIPLSHRENGIICVCVEDEASPLPPQVLNEKESGVEKMLPPFPLFPLPECKNGELVLGDEWPSLPPRSSVQGMSPLSSLPPSRAKSGGGWMELFANNNENSTDSSDVGLALSSHQRSSIKRTKPSPPLPLIPLHSIIKQQNRDPRVPPLLHKSIEKKPSPPPPGEIKEVEETFSPERKINKQTKSKQAIIQKTFQNPFALLADMEKEDSTPQGTKEKSPAIRISNRKNRRRPTKSFDRVDKSQSAKSFLIHISTLLWIFPFLLVLLTSK